MAKSKKSLDLGKKISEKANSFYENCKEPLKDLVALSTTSDATNFNDLKTIVRGFQASYYLTEAVNHVANKLEEAKKQAEEADKKMEKDINIK